MAAKINPVCMPKLGMEMTEGILTRWIVAEGGKVARGDELFDIETEKLTNPYVAEFAGVLRRRTGVEGETYLVGHLVGVVAEAGVSDAELDQFIAAYQSGGDAGAEAVSSAPVANTRKPAADYLNQAGVDSPPLTKALQQGTMSGDGPGGYSGPSASIGSKIRSSPKARRLAREQGINLAQVAGSGRAGMVLCRDLPGVGAGSAAQSGLRYRAVPLTKMRQTIARRLVQSKLEAPHIYLRIEVNMSAVQAMRASINKRSADKKISVNDCLVRATALALLEVPAANVQFHGTEMRYFDQADVGVAVAIEGGLVSPVIRDAGRKSLQQIAQEISDLASRARNGRLSPADIEGGTITLSNLGMFGISSFDAIINPPQAVILAVGAVEERPANVGGQLALAPMLHVTMSCDHRAIDGAVGAEFLRAFKGLLENPVNMMT